MIDFELIYRHGYVILFKLKEDDKRASQNAIKKMDNLVLEEGEVTGHAHRLNGSIEVLEENLSERQILFRIEKNALLTHEEHDRMVLDRGVYLKVSQVEYDPFSNMIHWIRD